MKKIPYYLILLFIALTVACNEHSSTMRSSTAKRTVIEGQIANVHLFPETKEFKLQVKNFTGDTSVYIGKVKKDGTFKIYFDQYIAQDVYIDPLVRTFIAHPGDSIHIELDYAKLGDIKFSGDAEKTNTDLYHYLSENYSDIDNESEYKKASRDLFETSDIQGHLNQSNIIRQNMLAKMDEFIKKFDPNSEVQTWIKNNIYINYYNSHVRFAKMLASKNQSSLDDLTQIKGLDNFEKDLDEIYQAAVLNTGSINLAWTLAPSRRNKSFSDFTDNVVKSRYDTLIKQIQIGSNYYAMLHENDIDAFNKNKSLFNKHITEPFIKQPLLKRYAAVKKYLDNPTALSNALLGNASKASPNALINSIKKENAGKVILIDVWATWCGPCIAEFPDSKKLMETYKGKDVKFVFLCGGTAKATYDNLIKELKLAQHYYLNKEETSALWKAFKMSGIPFKILINKNGDIVELGNGLRPDNELTSRKIDKLLVGNRLAANINAN
jgi:thiol-disulfide isomerase/thioredoxin